MGITPSTPTSTDYVELHMFILSLSEVYNIYNFPSEIVTPFWLFISEFTANDTSTHHLPKYVLLASVVRFFLDPLSDI